VRVKLRRRGRADGWKGGKEREEKRREREGKK
jgi:hypothetical protein